MLTESEIKILETYVDGKDVPTEEKELVLRAGTLGWVHVGMRFENGRAIPTASLTKKGRDLIPVFLE